MALVENAEIVEGNSRMVRSPSGDIDILVLFLLHQFDGKNVLIDNGVGKNRKIIDMSTSLLSLQQRCALAGMHAFSGNDYISSFFRKGTQTIWELALGNERFLQTFSEFGLFSTTREDVEVVLEEFICCLSGNKKCKKVNELRGKIFQTKFKHEGKHVDMISLPP